MLVGALGYSWKSSGRPIRKSARSLPEPIEVPGAVKVEFAVQVIAVKHRIAVGGEEKARLQQVAAAGPGEVVGEGERVIHDVRRAEGIVTGEQAAAFEIDDGGAVHQVGRDANPQLRRTGLRADGIVLLGVVPLRREPGHVDGGGRKAVRVTHIAHIRRDVVGNREAIHRGGARGAGERDRARRYPGPRRWRSAYRACRCCNRSCPCIRNGWWRGGLRGTENRPARWAAARP